MPGLNMSFKAAAGGGGGKIKANPVSIGAYGMEIHSETAHYGGSTYNPKKAAVEAVTPPKPVAKTRAGGRSGGMFG